ncbi:cytochrome P450 [Penicillium lividum]|nr:cytochrome P450 [Penicillium lividum]
MFTATSLAILSGVLAHWAVFIHSEWHLKIMKLGLTHLAIYAALYVIRIGREEYNLHNEATPSPTILMLLYFSSLFTSIGIYRYYFHQLRAFPGPRLAAISKLWHVWKCRTSRGHLVLHDWQKYGTFVRTGTTKDAHSLCQCFETDMRSLGPAEITVYHPGAYEAMDGPGNQNTRSDWRKMWTNSLSSSAIRQYHNRIIDKVNTLVHLIDEQVSRPVYVNDIMYWFAFDSMGDFAFSEDFGMMKSKKWHQIIWMFRYALALLGPFSPAIWIPRLAFEVIPGLWWAKWWFQMLKFCDKCMERRMKRNLPEKDIASFFIEEHKSSVDQRKDHWLSGDTATLVVAGSDTNAPTLTILFYFLTRHPEHADKIYAELQTMTFLEDAVGLSKLPHLNGVLNETMRLIPAVLTFGTRVSPPEGLTIEGTFIPGGTKICAPRYSIGRLESAYGRPDEFIPERWYSQPDLIRDRRAFAPFGVGNTSCVGKNLALTQIRMVAAALVSRYHLDFAPESKNGELVEKEMKDQLTAQPGPCHLVFTPRIEK